MSANFPELCLGGNVFGWTADKDESFAVLDAAREAGITFIDTADVYSAWAHNGKGGQSESIIGDWMADRGVRDEIVVATKVGMHPGLDNIRPDTLHSAADTALERLKTDRIDLFYAHQDDDGDLAESLAAFDALVKDGKIRMVGLSNFTGARIHEAMEICERVGLTPPVVSQPKYSLVERDFETSGERDEAIEHDLTIVPYFSLASGFLTGKYRPDGDDVESQRAGSAAKYLDSPSGPAVLEALDAAAEAHDVPVASVALAWLRAQPGAVTPLASARTVEQVAPLAQSIGLELDDAEVEALTAASEK